MSPSNGLLVLLVHYLLSKLIDEKGHCLTGAVVPELVRGFLALSLENSRFSEGTMCLWHFWFRYNCPVPLFFSTLVD